MLLHWLTACSTCLRWEWKTVTRLSLIKDLQKVTCLKIELTPSIHSVCILLQGLGNVIAKPMNLEKNHLSISLQASSRHAILPLFGALWKTDDPFPTWYSFRGIHYIEKTTVSAEDSVNFKKKSGRERQELIWSLTRLLNSDGPSSALPKLPRV